MRLDRGLAYSALLCPAGVHVVAYRRAGGGVRVEWYTRELRSPLRPEEAAGILGDLLESQGARRRPVSIAVTGFGTCHQILTLPRAGREVLEPVVTRELRRFYPDLFAAGELPPVIDFVELESSESAATSQKDLLVAAVPRGFLESVVSTLAARGIRLDHWTIVPRAIQRLYDAFGDSEKTAAALVMVPGWPLLGFFHERELRLFSEPRSGPAGSGDGGLALVVEHVERGAIFLRQQFRGAAVSQLFLAPGPEVEFATLPAELSQALSLPVSPFGPTGEAPGAFAALGAALDAASDDALNLMPAELRPPSEADRWTRRLVLASAAVLLAASGWWGWRAAQTERQAQAEVQTLTRQLAARGPQIAAIRPVMEARQAHAQRATLLEILSRDRRRLPEVLWPVQAAAPQVAVRSLDIDRDPAGWRVALTVKATAMSYDQATDALTALRHQLAAELPEDALKESGIALDRASPADSGRVEYGPVPIAATAQMTFIVPVLKEKTQ
jgi:hypothetical protein